MESDADVVCEERFSREPFGERGQCVGKMPASSPADD
jgi:hypothetical protein